MTAKFYAQFKKQCLLFTFSKNKPELIHLYMKSYKYIVSTATQSTETVFEVLLVNFISIRHIAFWFCLDFCVSCPCHLLPSHLLPWIVLYQIKTLEQIMQSYLHLNIITNKILVMRKWNNLLLPESLNWKMSNLYTLDHLCQLATTFSLHPHKSWLNSNTNKSWPEHSELMR